MSLANSALMNRQSYAIIPPSNSVWQMESHIIHRHTVEWADVYSNTQSTLDYMILYAYSGMEESEANHTISDSHAGMPKGLLINRLHSSH